MNVLFLSISAMPHLDGHSISIDLLHEFVRQGHAVTVVCAQAKGQETALTEEAGCRVLRVKIGGNKKANPIVKGITTLLLPRFYISAIKRYFADVKFDLVLYPTPPITHADTVRFIKKRDGAMSYLLLKDIFPQNAVDIGMMRKSGVKGILYRHFRRKERQLYALSDRIGCMSEANVDYVLRHNPTVSPDKIEVCPNSIEPQDMRISEADKLAIREKYGVPADKCVFVYGGNLGRPQGIPFVMECLKAQRDNPDAFFLLVGDGTEYRKLEAFMAETKPQNAVLLQKLPKEDYDRLVAACDVGLIFLDHRFTIPNFPSRLLGYMQAGVPVLACTDPNTDIGKVITEGGFGWWCESNDVTAFGDCVKAAIAADRGAMVQKELDYLTEHYTVDVAYTTIMKHGFDTNR